METGELQALQNLNQLTSLTLAGCYELTGQSESESCSGTTSTGFHWLIPGTLAPLAGLSQLQLLNVSYTNFTGQSVSEFVWRQPGSHVIGGKGELQPLQNLNQLTDLSLRGCEQLTGQSVSENCSGTTSM